MKASPSTLIIVDVQRDFCTGGALAVREGEAVVPVINALAPLFDLVVATQDWHPPGHGSFASSYPGRAPFEMSTLGGRPQVLWPDHCVQGTGGAEFHPDLDTDCVRATFRKGTNHGVDSYSGFLDNDREGDTGLRAYLKQRGTRHVHVVGLATDYCVKATALDALAMGFGVTVISDACRAVEMTSGDGDLALAEIRAAGGEVLTSAEVIAGRNPRAS